MFAGRISIVEDPPIATVAGGHELRLLTRRGALADRARTARRYAAMYSRLTRDLGGFVRQPLSGAQAETIVADRLRRRPELLLWLVEHAIYRHPRSPYLKLLNAVGCELGDLRRLVDEEGVEGALAELAGRGVYLAFEEAKGGRPVVRGSVSFTPDESDFWNPLYKPHFEVRTGGTRSSGTRVPMSLEFMADFAVSHAAAFHAFGLDDAEHVLWHTGPLRDLLFHPKLGHIPAAWFHPLHPLPWPVRTGAILFRLAGRIAGVRFPRPVWQDPHHPGPLLDWLEERIAGRPVVVTSLSSSAVRLAMAAQANGRRLDNVTFFMRGEPFTTAKRDAIEAVGARAVDCYGFVENGGAVGRSCQQPAAVDDLHLFTDRVAVTQQRRRLGRADGAADGVGGVEVEALQFSSLLPTAPWILLNVENGDHGVLERRECGCPLGALGLQDHLRGIASHEKLTIEGQTFLRSTLVEVLEEELPARFGGGAMDYQLVEESGSLSRLVLVVHPNVGPVDEAALKRVVLEHLSGGVIGNYMSQVVEKMGALEVRRAAPYATQIGKVMPLHRVREAVG